MEEQIIVLHNNGYINDRIKFTVYIIITNFEKRELQLARDSQMVLYVTLTDEIHRPKDSVIDRYAGGDRDKKINIYCRYMHNHVNKHKI
jgi:hypothetical protein